MQAKNILIVDNDPLDARLLAENLAAVLGAGISIHHAATADEALRHLERNEPVDLVFVDVHLTGRDENGIALIHTILERRPALAVIGYSGTNGEAVADACRRAGAEDFLCKSEIQPAVLARAVRSALAHARMRPRGAWAAGGSPAADPVRIPEEVQREYRALVDAYLDQRVAARREPGKATARFGPRPPRQRMEEIALRLAELGAGPKDLMDMHVRVLDEAVRVADAERARACALEGSFLALEMMSHLAERYRSLWKEVGGGK